MARIGTCRRLRCIRAKADTGLVEVLHAALAPCRRTFAGGANPGTPAQRLLQNGDSLDLRPDFAACGELQLLN